MFTFATSLVIPACPSCDVDPPAYQPHCCFGTIPSYSFSATPHAQIKPPHSNFRRTRAISLATAASCCLIWALLRSRWQFVYVGNWSRLCVPLSWVRRHGSIGSRPWEGVCVPRPDWPFLGRWACWRTRRRIRQGTSGTCMISKR